MQILHYINKLLKLVNIESNKVLRMISDQYKVRIGFGNNSGKTIKVVLEESQNKIERLNRKTNSCPNPKVVFKTVEEISLSPFTEMIYQKRDQAVIAQLLRIQQTDGINKILQKCRNDTKILQNDLTLIGSFVQNLKIDQFMTNSGCETQAEANKYLTKYKNPQQAIKKFKEHAKIIEDFRQMNKCSIQDAISYLEPNDYDINLFK